jgi:hypothetical protein
MTKCNNCDVVDLGINHITKNDEIFDLCSNCGAEDSVEEIDEMEWAEDMEMAEADFLNELQDDCE